MIPLDVRLHGLLPSLILRVVALALSWPCRSFPIHWLLVGTIVNEGAVRSGEECCFVSFAFSHLVFSVCLCFPAKKSLLLHIHDVISQERPHTCLETLVRCFC